MIVVKIHPFTKEVRSRELNITEEQMAKYNSGELAQNAFPNLNSEEREFIISGLMGDEFDKLYQDSEDSQKCPNCDGHGQTPSDEDWKKVIECDICNGTGIVK